MSLGLLLFGWVAGSVPIGVLIGRAMAGDRQPRRQPLPVRSHDNVVVLRPAAERVAIARARRMHPSCWSEADDERPAFRLHSLPR
ncbi:MAG: hypothetical protein JWO37_3529 [Acidimicrobiales bacterium]|jgi:hypothetical protein|nr:hypothetical protein [Acidimicrobiales bacterium]